MAAVSFQQPSPAGQPTLAESAESRALVQPARVAQAQHASALVSLPHGRRRRPRPRRSTGRNRHTNRRRAHHIHSRNHRIHIQPGRNRPARSNKRVHNIHIRHRSRHTNCMPPRADKSSSRRAYRPKTFVSTSAYPILQFQKVVRPGGQFWTPAAKLYRNYAIFVNQIMP